MSLRGFDVSHWQGAIDWPALKAAHGITFGAAKATEGVSFTDDRFPANWTGMESAGLVRMAYHYGHPKNDPVAEADHFASHIPPAGIPGAIQATDLLVLDLETGDGLSQVEVNRWAKVWAGRITELFNRRPVLYCGHAYMENQTGVGLNGPFSAWFYPRYPNSLANQASWPTAFNPTLPSPNAWGGPPDFWQYSSTFPSGQGSIDADVFHGTLAQLRALNTGG